MNRRVARRDFLIIAGAVAGHSGETARAAPPVRERPTFVLVHGAWHSSYCWCEVANQLRLDGFRVVAIDLPGHGLDARYPASQSFALRVTSRSADRPPAEAGAERVTALVAATQNAWTGA